MIIESFHMQICQFTSTIANHWGLKGKPLQPWQLHCSKTTLLLKFREGSLIKGHSSHNHRTCLPHLLDASHLSQIFLHSKITDTHTWTAPSYHVTSKCQSWGCFFHSLENDFNLLTQWCHWSKEKWRAGTCIYLHAFLVSLTIGRCISRRQARSRTECLTFRCYLQTKWNTFSTTCK